MEATQATGTKLGPIRPDKLTIWPLETGFGIDVTWSGADGNRRADTVKRLTVTPASGRG